MGIFMLELSPGALQIKVLVFKLFGKIHQVHDEGHLILTVSLLHSPGPLLRSKYG